MPEQQTASDQQVVTPDDLLEHIEMDAPGVAEVAEYYAHIGQTSWAVAQLTNTARRQQKITYSTSSE